LYLQTFFRTTIGTFLHFIVFYEANKLHKKFWVPSNAQHQSKLLFFPLYPNLITWLFHMLLFIIFNYASLMWVIITCLTFVSHKVMHMPFQTNLFKCISIKNICSLVPYYAIGERWHSGPQEIAYCFTSLWTEWSGKNIIISIQPLGQFGRNQSPVRRPVWLWYAAF
jgi:hypothetical protein